jgi:acyl-CoA reductase-like NAD-dependent aldehyde dehydrogenase
MTSLDDLLSSTHRPGTLSPATGELLTDSIKTTSVDQIKDIVASAITAQKAWGAMPLESRAALCQKLASTVLERHHEIAEIMSLETGRSPLECTMSEVVSLPASVKTHIKVAKEALKPQRMPISFVEYPGKSAVVEQLPRGVVAIIAPWNYPLGNFWKHLFPALLSGNSVVLKPSEYTPRTGEWLAQVCQTIFPAGVVSCVNGGGDVGAALLESGIHAVTFTGSVPTGRKVAARAGQLLIPATVELGGKDAAIVLADCDLNRTAVGIAQWAMHNCGHNCAAIERVYVEESIADAFVDRLSNIVSRMRVAEKDNAYSELGPVQNAPQLSIVMKHIDDAVSQGAILRAGGKPTGKGLGFAPTVLDKCTQNMHVVSEETFGPVVAIVRVKDADEAVALANDSRYGLNGSVWTRDIARGEAIARRLEVGVALVNNHAITGTLSHLPWTGVKETGTGVAASKWSYHVFTRPRTLFTDRSSKPDPWWIPADPNLSALCEALIQRGQGSLSATLKLAGIVGKRVKAIESFAAKLDSLE